MKSKLFPDQIIPLLLTGVVFAVVTVILFAEIRTLNGLTVNRPPVHLQLRLADILVGATIYLKTSIDFAIFIGRLMSKYEGWKNRIMIEIGTALGNAAGTFLILLIWDFFREVPILMAIMIMLAALVLLRMAEDGLDHVKDEAGKYKISFGGFEIYFEKVLSRFNRFVAPVLNKLIPSLVAKDDNKKGLKALFIMSMTIPFILGLDDFAGYLPLFNIINVFGFATGVFLGHMILNIFLFLSPGKTIRIVKNPIISFFGSLAFVGLALWGVIEAVKLLLLSQ
ncbi:MAG TPA: hypothetical protein VLH19_04080 [Patescibacteria group bacterium]|nr:hypothetical protein [Patescibacteria group bacterium]